MIYNNSPFLRFERGSLQICAAIVKNQTNLDLENIELVLLQKHNFPTKIKKIRKGYSKREGIVYTAPGNAPVKMYYTDLSNIKHEYTILEDLEAHRGRLICITITNIDEEGNLKFNVNPRYNENEYN